MNDAFPKPCSASPARKPGLVWGENPPKLPSAGSLCLGSYLHFILILYICLHVLIFTPGVGNVGNPSCFSCCPLPPAIGCFSPAPRAALTKIQKYFLKAQMETGSQEQIHPLDLPDLLGCSSTSCSRDSVSPSPERTLLIRKNIVLFKKK